MTDQHNLDSKPLDPHWDIDWTEQGVAENLLPWWIGLIWILFLVWGVIYIVDSSANW